METNTEPSWQNSAWFIEKWWVELVEVENKVGQWAPEGVRLVLFVMPTMWAGQWQRDGQPRISKGPGYSSVGTELFMAHWLKCWISQSNLPHPTLHSNLPMDVGNKRLQYRWEVLKASCELNLQPTLGSLFITQLFYGPLGWAQNTESSEAGQTNLSLTVWDRGPRASEESQRENFYRQGRTVFPRGWLMSQSSISATFYPIQIFYCIGLMWNLPIIKVEKMVDFEVAVKWNTNNAHLIHSLNYSFIYLDNHYYLPTMCKVSCRIEIYKTEAHFFKLTNLHAQGYMAYTHLQMSLCCTWKMLLSSINEIRRLGR